MTPIYFTEATENGRWRVVQATPKGCVVMSTCNTKRLAETCLELWRMGAEVKAAKLTETVR